MPSEVELQLGADGDPVIGVIREIVDAANRGIHDVSSASTTGGGSGSFAYGTSSKEQEEQLRRLWQDQQKQLEGAAKANKGKRGGYTTGRQALLEAGRNSARQLSDLFGGPGGLFGLSEQDLKSLKGQFTRNISAIPGGAARPIAQGFRNQLEELQKSPDFQGARLAQQRAQQRNIENIAAVSELRNPSALGANRNLQQALLNTGTVFAQRQLLGPDGKPFLSLAGEAARSAKLRTNAVQSEGATRLTNQDFNNLGSHRANTAVATNLEKASTILVSLGKNLDGLDVKTVTLAQSMQILNEAEGQQAATIRAAKEQQLGRGSIFQRLWYNSQHRSATDTSVAAESQNFGQFSQRHAVNTLGYAIPGIAIGGAFEELSKSVTEAAEAQKELAEVQAEFQALGQGGQFQGYSTAIQSIASQTGVAVNEVAQLALAFKGVFGSTQQAQVALLAAAQGAQALGVSISTLQEDLTGISQAFDSLRNQGGSSFKSIQNEALHLQDVFGVPAAQTLAGTADIAPIAQQLGLSPKYTMALVAATAQRSGYSGTDIGSAFGRILPGIAQNEGLLYQQYSTLGAVGQPVTKAIQGGNGEAIVNALLQSLPKLSGGLAAGIIQELGGNASSRAILLSAAQGVGAKGFEGKATSVAPQNRLQEEFNKEMSTVLGQLNRFGTSLSNLGVEILSSNLGGTLADLVGGARELVEAFAGINTATHGLASEFAEVGLGILVLSKLVSVGGSVGRTVLGKGGGGALVGGATKAGDILVASAEKAGAALQGGGARAATEETAGGGILTGGVDLGVASSLGKLYENSLGANVGLKTFTSGLSLAAIALSGFAGYKFGDFLLHFSQSPGHNVLPPNATTGQKIGHYGSDIINGFVGGVQTGGAYAGDVANWLTGAGAKAITSQKADEQYQQQYQVNKLLGYTFGHGLENLTDNERKRGFSGLGISAKQQQTLIDKYGPGIIAELKNVETAITSGRGGVHGNLTDISTFRALLATTSTAVTATNRAGPQQTGAVDLSPVNVANRARRASIAAGTTGIGNAPLSDFTGVQTAYEESGASFNDLAKSASAAVEAARIAYRSRTPGSFDALQTALSNQKQIYDALSGQQAQLAQSLVQQGSASTAPIAISLKNLSGTKSLQGKQQLSLQAIQDAQTVTSNAAGLANTAAQANAITARGYTFNHQQTEEILASFGNQAKTLADLQKVGLAGSIQGGQLHIAGAVISASSKFQAAQQGIQAKSGLAQAQAFNNPLLIAQQQETEATQQLLAAQNTKFVTGKGQNYQTLQAQVVQGNQAVIVAQSSATQAKIGFYAALFSQDPLKSAQETVKQAQAAVALASQQGGASNPAYWQALGQEVQGQQQELIAKSSIKQAQFSYYASLFAENPQQAAQQTEKQGQAALALAQKQKNPAAVSAALQQVVGAQYSSIQGTIQNLQALGSVQEAVANLAGQPYQAALVQQSVDQNVYNTNLQALTKLYQNDDVFKKTGVTLKQFLSANSTLNQELAATKSDQANSMQALVSQSINVVESQLTLGQITVTQGIAELYGDLQKVKGNQQETLQIETEIRQLQNSAGANLNFNLPTSLVPSTLYAARLAEATNGNMATSGGAQFNFNVTVNGGSASQQQAFLNKVNRAVGGPPNALSRPGLVR